MIELKRTEGGGHMELQAIRDAAMISTMTFDQAVSHFGRYLHKREDDRDALETMLEILGWDEPDEEGFANEIKIILAAADFSQEITSSILWLNECGLDIRCVRLRPCGTKDDLFLDVQQVIPLPEAADYQVRVREKQQREREAGRDTRDNTQFNVIVAGRTERAMYKRRAILAIVRELCNNGVCPNEIEPVIEWRSNLFKATDGELDGESFITAMAASDDPKFDARRYFIETSELIHKDGRTHAFTNQWGIRTEAAMKALLDHFDPANISFERT